MRISDWSSDVCSSDLLCAHSEEGAMGIVINRELESITFDDLMEQLDIETAGEDVDLPVQSGGPVETGRGFVLHSPDYRHEGTLVVADDVALTATVDILRAIAEGDGPRRRILAPGYAGWDRKRRRQGKGGDRR